MKYFIRDEYAQVVVGSNGNYDMSCRIAHFMRECGTCDFFVVNSTGVASSEVTDINVDLDNFAKERAQRLWNTHKRKV